VKKVYYSASSGTVPSDGISKFYLLHSINKLVCVVDITKTISNLLSESVTVRRNLNGLEISLDCLFVL